MQRDITSKVQKSHVQVRPNFRKITKLQYFGVQLFSYIFYLHDFLSYEIQKHNERIYNSLSNICRICNDFRIFKNIKRNLLDQIGSDVIRELALQRLRYLCMCVSVCCVNAALNVIGGGTQQGWVVFDGFPVCYLLFLLLHSSRCTRHSVSSTYLLLFSNYNNVGGGTCGL